ncbi:MULTISPECIES: DUF2164 domain-containing protein [unclassified Rhizobium]|uniref:DUF2164 domain-containing protein n=1 Tax=unclassified Rhizobium TaxID=2613769 RepID=UPI001A993A8B|nr:MULTISPECIES: DUF2164 domain-containing protein [unclassified Rhizobium]MBX5164938.1 DUF2164 domain-containing protein [Rhizobium sp. NZLR4b]MBX5170072.1 DUF2164 domain-containing protein [Rhizobium sp. NZLR1b]MBX5184880.1 DUF2164 domain-containing protein [Rhizobium sp. NZLR5]MBX5189733.1 DUF2164 domain-containing protein [Rhizobium sp. NZLR3b]MBX5194985.1 DUF2164 domain-containing protein [Rhizobium sp. NZLR10]
MKKIEFSKEAKTTIVSSIRRYFETELDQSIGVLPAEFLLDFFADEIGAHYYNQGLRDAHAALLKKMEDLAEDIYLLERDEKSKGTIP